MLVDRYVRLLEAGVAPRNILAITFTRKAAAEMRQRVMATLRQRHREGGMTEQRWREIRDSFGDIGISTIDAFCLSLLHEFPLEAGVDPGFDLADETETPRFIEASLDSALAIGRAISLEDARRRAAVHRARRAAPAEGADGAARSPAGGARRAQPLPARPRDERRGGVPSIAALAAWRGVVDCCR